MKWLHKISNELISEVKEHYDERGSYLTMKFGSKDITVTREVFMRDFVEVYETEEERKMYDPKMNKIA